MKKIILIGIDGATPELIEKWIDNGNLPNFKKLKENGVYGRLKSTTPPFSAPAWTSIITGCNPGKHGIYGFENTGTLESQLINSNCRRAPAIWNYLSNIGIKNIVVNVPGTYPPEKIDGIMITGLLTPSPDSNFTYPMNIKKRLHENDLGEYKLEQLWLEDFSRSRMKKHVPEKLLYHINNQMASRMKIGLNLMKETDWGFTMIVFRGTDTAQHFLFERQDLMLSCYQKVDDLIGNILEINPEAVFFVVSDHGFEKIKKIFYPDNLLYNAGYLIPIQDPYKSSIFLLYHKIFDWIFKHLPQKILKESKLIKKLLFLSSSKDKLIDFSKTKAFSTADGRGIQICRKNKFKSGVVEEKDYNKLCDEISVLLKELKDPYDNSPIIENVYRWNEIYSKNAFNPPDLVFDLKKGITAAEYLRFPDTLFEVFQTKKNLTPFIFSEDSVGRSGDHSQYGIFFAYGKGIKTNYKIDNISVQDVLPTIFSAIGISIPNTIDGISKKDIFIKKPIVKNIDWKSYQPAKQMLKKSELDKINELREKQT